MLTTSVCLLVMLLLLSACGQAPRNAPAYTPDSLNYRKAAVMVSFQKASARRESAIQFWDSLLSASTRLDMSLYEARIHYELGYLFHVGRSTEKAYGHFNQCKTIAEKFGYRKELGAVLFRLGMYHSMRMNRKATLQCSYNLLRLADETADEAMKVKAYSILALYYLTTGEYKQALPIHIACYKLCLKMNDRMGCASALSDIACDYQAMCDTLTSSHYYLLSGSYLKDAKGKFEEVILLTNVASAYTALKKYDSALYFGMASYKTAEAHKAKYGMASAAVSLALTYAKVGRFHEALAFAGRAHKLVTETSFVSQIPDLLTTYRFIYEQMGNYRKALEVADQLRKFKDSTSGELARRQSLEQAYLHKMELHQKENKLLFQRNSIQSLELKQKQTWLSVLLFTVLAIILMVLGWLRYQRLRVSHQLIQLEQKLLYTQMNPHFIFNSLNAIQQLVMQGKNQLSETYLNRFAKLMRELLESSTRETQLLSTEISMLKAYLEMESLRFGSVFTYKVEVEDNVHASTIAIPHLMIQPFVENAIWHGLLPSAGEKLLHVHISQEGPDCIKCVIDDNGMGRKAAAERSSHGKQTKKSLAVKLVTKRLKLIKSVYGIEGRLTFNDKLDNNGTSLGTTVELILPIVQA